MMTRYILLTLRAFEAAARHLSFTRAAIGAQRHSAISQHVKALEQQEELSAVCARLPVG